MILFIFDLRCGRNCVLSNLCHYKFNKNLTKSS
jgi:hypothetical protein